MDKKVNFSSFDNSWYKPGSNIMLRTLWYFINLIVFNSHWYPINGLKIILLKLFGAKLGKSCVIKPAVNIKYPWRLRMGDNVWLGENVWIDNLENVTIGNNVCISQGAFLLCGNHNYKTESFDLMVGSIKLEDGVWIGAKSIVCPNVTAKENSVLTAGSVANKDLKQSFIHKGNPAVQIKERIIES